MSLYVEFNQMINILVLVNGALRRQGFVGILNQAAFGKPVNVVLAMSRQEGLTQLERKNWHALIIDLDFDDAPAFELIANVRKHYRSLPILAFDFSAEPHRLARALRSGASGIAGKIDREEDIRHAVKAVLTGRKYIHSDCAEFIVDAMMYKEDTPTHEGLSNREMQTLSLVMAGKKRCQIAEAMAISTKTVSVYRTRLMQKLNLFTTEGLIRYGIEHHIGRQ